VDEVETLHAGEARHSRIPEKTWAQPVEEPAHRMPEIEMGPVFSPSEPTVEDRSPTFSEEPASRNYWPELPVLPPADAQDDWEFFHSERLHERRRQKEQEWNG
jgi:hypothetical protein